MPEMPNRTRIAHLALAVTVLAGLPLVAATPVDAAQCFRKAASGTNTTLEGAKFQVYEALLQSFDWGVWASWMASGTTPGYRVAPPKYTCSKGGLGYNCRGVTTICKT
jgi:hypothetical protein